MWPTFEEDKSRQRTQDMPERYHHLVDVRRFGVGERVVPQP
jgi:16S rRNA U1498 N3-methylase RsmE